MGSTITEKILAKHAGKKEVKAGELIQAKLDFVLGNDITAPIAINEFEKAGFDKVFDKERIGLIPDHFTPNKDIKSAEQVKQLREFSKKHGITHFYDVGRVGVEHALIPEKGLALPGDCIIGADSHTCTYGALGAFSTGVGSTDLAYAMATGEAWFKVPEAIKFVYNGELPKWSSAKDIILYTIGLIGVDGALYKTMEFTGETISGLSLEGRMTIANMAIEAGGKNGIFAVDEKTLAYVRERAARDFEKFESDDDAVYEKVIEINAKDIEPQVSLSPLPDKAKPVRECTDMVVDQVIIGSCTNGRIEDLRAAAAIIKGKKVSSNIRCIIIPATQEVWKQANDEGLLDIFVESEAAVSAPTCGPCLGGHMGILAKGERALATTNRNFVGRMGHPESEVLLCSPEVAAASAITGRVTHPEEVI